MVTECLILFCLLLRRGRFQLLAVKHCKKEVFIIGVLKKLDLVLKARLQTKCH